MATKISQNKPFANRPNSNNRIGPAYFNWCSTGYNGDSNSCNNGSLNLGKRRRGVGLTGKITPEPNMEYVSTIFDSTVNDCVKYGATNQLIYSIKITTKNNNNPLVLDKINLTISRTIGILSGTKTVYIYYTGNNNNYSNTNLYGNANYVGLSNTVNINGSQELLNGDNYFWVVYQQMAAHIIDDYDSFSTTLNYISLDNQQTTLSYIENNCIVYP